ncbi:MAG TPA: class I SAM-dependent methyltransferase [Candidatus Koribacter sp.]|jgi:2-polyprenyl-3-methyl-5-hydroxy-6-metoxy-1,4-benzoquinol methylase
MSNPSITVQADRIDHERRRLALQASVLNPLTDSFLRRAGVAGGMRVLEIGCGIGEVSLITARLLGPHGRLHCIDIDAAALETAQTRCRNAGHDHVSFEHTDVASHTPVRAYDAIIGRHVLIQVPDALAVLKKSANMVHVGGLIAFQEYDLSYAPKGYPEMPMMHSAVQLIVDYYLRAVPRPNIGAQLFYLMQEAGLPSPECRASSVMDGGPNSPVYEWVTETIRSLLPGMEALGMMTGAVVSDSLPQRLREEALQTRGAAIMPPMIGAFARKPFAKIER